MKRLNTRSFLAVAILSFFITGFDLSRHSIPIDEIISGGPPKDGIPAILHPKFISSKEAGFLRNDDRVLGIKGKGEVKAYPVNIMNWHEIVNDTIDGRPVVITYCPLCGTGIGFEAVIDDRTYTFGVSGMLYNSDVLLYDHQTESLWSQIGHVAVTGKMTGKELTMIPLMHTTWSEWRNMHPDTLVLSSDTGYFRDYGHDPYIGYYSDSRTMFPVKKTDSRYHAKEWVLGIEVDGRFKAYPFSELKKTRTNIKDIVNKREIVIYFNPDSRNAYVVDKEGKILPSIIGFWFAWYAFHPDTLVYEKIQD
ncbi:MAG: DUF3179 domain-containing protein [Nitrospirota bacterium]